MLLLVIETDLEDAQHLGELRSAGLVDEPHDRSIDMRAIGRDLAVGRPRHQSALRARMPRPGRDIVGVEQIGELLVEDAVARQMRQQQELLEEPGRMRPMPFGRTGVRHRLDDLILVGKRRRAPLGFAAHLPEGLDPGAPHIAAREPRPCPASG